MSGTESRQEEVARRGGHRRWLAVAALFLVGSAALIGCRGGSDSTGRRWPLARGQAAGSNILLVTLDTVRRDRLGCYGDRDASTPTLDRLAAGGVRFDDAVTSVPLTLPSHATILTGRYPPNHGARANGKGLLRPEQLTLAETLRDRGFDTAAFVAAFVLDARFGLDQGFTVYDFEVSEEGFRATMPDYNERTADQVTDAALTWFRSRRAARAERPFFAWVHYFDAHQPYASPLERAPAFAGRPYDAEIAFIDQQLGRLLDDLDGAGELDRTVVVVAGDHGEALGEHGEETHGMLLYDATMRVPLILSCPALLGGGQVDSRVVGLVDLRPTIEELLGLPVAAPCDGRSLLDADGGGDRGIYIETREPLDLAGWSPLDGLRTKTHKLIDGPVPRLFDIAADPMEASNLQGSGLAVEATLTSELATLRQGFSVAAPAERLLTDEELERLRSLGYEFGDSELPSAEAVDPETMMPVLTLSSRAEALYLARQLDQAESVARQVLEQWPASPHALRVLAFSLLKTGRSQEAVELLRAAVARHPDTFLVRSLAQVLILDGEYESAADVLSLYEALDPLDGRVEMLRGDVLARQRRTTEAAAAYHRALTLDPNRVGPAARERIAALEQEPGEPG
jgi:choline-sulfatase